MISQADSLDAMLIRDGYKLHDVFKDGVHPNDLGMQYVAKIITNELDNIYNKLPTDNKLPKLKSQLLNYQISVFFQVTL